MEEKAKEVETQSLLVYAITAESAGTVYPSVGKRTRIWEKAKARKGIHLRLLAEKA